MLVKETRVHFVGIGGVGMSALAQVLLEAGHQVSGSDLNRSDFTARLRRAGIRIAIGHRAENVGAAELVVVSSAVPQSNPEVQYALSKGVRIIKRADLLGELTRKFRSIAVAGTHGKTTTSSMIGFILERAGLDPTLLIGGTIANLGTNAKMGRGQYLVAEADEFDGSFLKLSPWMAVVTNVEADHLDFYHSMEAIETAFGQFIASVPEDGCVILCADDLRLMRIAGAPRARVISYALGTRADWQAQDIVANADGGNDFTAVADGREVGRFSLRVPGRHNVQNALAAIAATTDIGVKPGVIAMALAEFGGARRRFELKGRVGGIAVYDDYAHHPTEIKATLRAARERYRGRLWCVFQPHTYHRTKQLWNDFLTAFGDADQVILCDIYLPAGREADTLGITSRDLARAMSHPGAQYIGDLKSAASYLCSTLQDGDVLVTMGAGNVYEVAESVVACLRKRLGGS